LAGERTEIRSSEEGGRDEEISVLEVSVPDGKGVPETSLPKNHPHGGKKIKVMLKLSFRIKILVEVSICHEKEVQDPYFIGSR